MYKFYYWYVYVVCVCECVCVHVCTQQTDKAHDVHHSNTPTVHIGYQYHLGGLCPWPMYVEHSWVCQQ